jgi:hypothetical protein
MATEKSGITGGRGAAEKERAGVAEHAVHVTNEFVRCADLLSCTEVREFGRGVAKGFLCFVSEGGQEMLEQDSLFLHASVSFLVKDGPLSLKV